MVPDDSQIRDAVETCFDEGTQDAMKYLKEYGEEEFKKVLQEEPPPGVGFHPGSLLDKLRQWNGVFKAKMEDAKRGKKRRRTIWRSIDAR
jgi:hypothetical protein